MARAPESGYGSHHGRLLIGCVLVALACLAWMTTRRDASLVSLKLTRGPLHAGPPAWSNQLLARMPAAWRKSLRLREPLVLRTVDPVIWAQGPLSLFQPRPPAVSTFAGKSAVPGLWLVDSRGMENRALARFGCGRADETSMTLGAVLDSLPRRSGTFTARWRGEDEAAGALLAEIECRVAPPRVPYGDWEPEPFPCRARSEGVTVKMRQAVVVAEPGRVPQARLEVQIPGAPEGAGAWRIERIMVRDATGNRTEVQTLGASSLEDGWSHVEFDWPLWSDESAWDIQLQLRPMEPEVLPPGDWKSVGSVRIPEPDAVELLDRTLLLDAGEVRLLGLVGPHATLPGREHDVHGLTMLELDYRPKDPADRAHRLLVFARETGGSRRPTVVSFAGMPNSWGFNSHEGMAALDISVAVVRLPEPGFRVRPGFQRKPAAAGAGQGAERVASPGFRGD